MISKVIIIGGWAQRSEDLAGLVKVLSDSSGNGIAAFECLGPGDLLRDGVENAERFSSASPSSYAANLSALLHPTEVSAVVGVSMGGLIALEAGLHFSERVERLVLINSTCCFINRNDRLGEYNAGIPRSRLRAMMLGMRGAPRITLNQFFQRVSTGGNDAEERAARALEEGPALLRHGLSYLEQMDFRSRLEHIRQHTLLLHSGSDKIIPPEASEWAAKLIPKARLQIIEGESHDLPMSDPSRCGEEILSFLRD